MISDLFASLVAFFLIDPVEAELRRRLATVNAPPSILAQAQACVADAGPKILQRATDEPAWAIRSSVSIGLGSSNPADILIDISPACEAPLALLSTRDDGDNV